MDRLDPLAWEILNATADDCENLEHIYHQVCCECLGAKGGYRPREGVPCLGEIATGVRRLVEAGLLTVVMDEEGRPWLEPDDISYVWRGWFRMTDRGEAVWAAEAGRGQSDLNLPVADLLKLPGA